MEAFAYNSAQEIKRPDPNDNVLEHFETYPEGLFFGGDYEAPMAKLESEGYEISLEIHNDYGREIYELMVKSNAGSTVWFYDPQEKEIKWIYIDDTQASAEEHARIEQLRSDVSEIFAQTAAQRIDLDNSLGTDSFDSSSAENFEAISAKQETTDFDRTFAETNGIDPESLNQTVPIEQGLGNTARIYSNV